MFLEAATEGEFLDYDGTGSKTRTQPSITRLVLPKFGHDTALDHLSSEYHEALCRIGAKLYALARRGEI